MVVVAAPPGGNCSNLSLRLRTSSFMSRIIGGDSEKALRLASKKNQLEEVVRLIRTGVNVNATSKDRKDYGRTALHEAAHSAGAAVTTALLRAGADVSAVTKETGDTPLLYAAARGKLEVVCILKQAGSDVEAVNKDGKSLLHFTVQYTELSCDLLRSGDVFGPMSLMRRISPDPLIRVPPHETLARGPASLNPIRAALLMADICNAVSRSHVAPSRLEARREEYMELALQHLGETSPEGVRSLLMSGARLGAAPQHQEPTTLELATGCEVARPVMAEEEVAAHVQAQWHGGTSSLAFLGRQGLFAQLNPAHRKMIHLYDLGTQYHILIPLLCVLVWNPVVFFAIPRVRFALDLCGHLALLLVHGHAVKLAPMNSIGQWEIAFYALSFARFAEKLRSASRHWRSYVLDSSWHKLELLLGLMACTQLGLRLGVVLTDADADTGPSMAGEGDSGDGGEGGLDAGDAGLLALAHVERRAYIAQVLMSMSGLLLWTRLLWYLNLVKGLGPFLEMIGRMLWDIANFVALLSVIMMGFVMGFYGMYRDELPDLFGSFGLAMQTLYQAMFGDFSLSDFDDSQHPTVGKVVLVVYTVVVALLLFNLLVAIMGQTYGDLEPASHALYIVNWAKVTRHYEREIHGGRLPPPFNVLLFFVFPVVHLCARLQTRSSRAAVDAATGPQNSGTASRAGVVVGSRRRVNQIKSAFYVFRVLVWPVSLLVGLALVCVLLLTVKRRYLEGALRDLRRLQPITPLTAVNTLLQQEKQQPQQQQQQEGGGPAIQEGGQDEGQDEKEEEKGGEGDDAAPVPVGRDDVKKVEVCELHAVVGGLMGEVGRLQDVVTRVQGDMSEVKQAVSRVQAEVGQLGRGVQEVQGGLGELKRDMNTKLDTVMEILKSLAAAPTSDGPFVRSEASAAAVGVDRTFALSKGGDDTRTDSAASGGDNMTAAAGGAVESTNGVLDQIPAPVSGGDEDKGSKKRKKKKIVKDSGISVIS